MRNTICIVMALASTAFAIGCGSRSPESAEETVQSDTEKVNWPAEVMSEEMTGTTLVPTLDTPISSTNTLWCATFQLAWNKACDVVGAPIELSNAEEVASRLNRSGVTEMDLLPGTYYANAGWTVNGIAETIRSEMEKAFPDHRPPSFESEDAMVAYAYLNSKVNFTTPYQESEISFTDAAGASHQVNGFKVHDRHDYELSKKHAKQVKVLYHIAEEENYQLSEFALDLSADQEDDQLIVAVMSRGESLSSMIARLNEQIENFDAQSAPRPSIVRVPNVITNIRHHFSEMEGPDKSVTNEGDLKGFYISRALQSIRFRLDKSGAVVASEAEIVFKSSPRESYRYIVNRPFLIMLKRRNTENPYFVAWIENVELLEVE